MDALKIVIQRFLNISESLGGLVKEEYLMIILG